MKKIVLLLFCITCIGTTALPQNKGAFQRKYLEAKELLKKRKFDQSYEAFLELTKEHKNNKFAAYAYYFCGLSAFELQKYVDARFSLVQLLEKYPDFDQRDEAKYLIANIAFEEKNIKKAFSYLSEIEEEGEVLNDAHSMSYRYLQKISSVDSLIELQVLYPQNNALVELLAKQLNNPLNPIKRRYLLSYLVQDYQLDSSKYSAGGMKKSVKKDQYNIAVMLPLMMGGEDKKDVMKHAQYIEMYEGIMMAERELEKQGIDVRLHIYDTQKDSAVVAELFELPEMLKMDLFLGPVYPMPAGIASDYALKHSVNYVNPLYANPKLTDSNPFTFLNKPSYINLGKQVATFAADSFSSRDVIILYEEGKLSDSITAQAYKEQIDSALIREVAHFGPISVDNIKKVKKKIKKMKEDDEEDDEYEISHIFISSSSDLMGAYLMTMLEEIDIKSPVLAPENWLRIQTTTFEQLRRREVYFYFTDYVDLEDEKVKDFREQFKMRMNLKPTQGNYATEGYEMMYFWANALHEDGTLFNRSLRKKGYMPGKLMSGYDYSKRQSNAVYSLMYLNDDYELVRANASQFRKKEKHGTDKE